jgi:hypothetical protein
MLRRLLLILAFIANSWPAYGTDAPSISLDTIVKTLQARDQALESFEARGRLYFGDIRCMPLPNTSQQEFVILHRSDGRREQRIDKIEPGGKRTLFQWLRDDGAKQYAMTCPPRSLEVVQSVSIKMTTNSASRNNMGMMPFLNAMTPRGVRLSNLVATGTDLESRFDESGDRIVRMTTQDIKLKIVLELSERHDFQPVLVQFPKRPKVVITEFVDVEGFWFPKNGHFDGIQQSGASYRQCFVVDHLRVNIDPPSDRFGLPKLMDGSFIRNDTNDGPRGVFISDRKRYRTEDDALADFRDKYGDKDAAHNQSFRVIDTAASRHPERHLATGWFLAGSFVTMIGGVILVYRRTQK